MITDKKVVNITFTESSNADFIRGEVKFDDNFIPPNFDVCEMEIEGQERSMELFRDISSLFLPLPNEIKKAWITFYVDDGNTPVASYEQTFDYMSVKLNDSVVYDHNRCLFTAIVDNMIKTSSDGKTWTEEHPVNSEHFNELTTEVPDNPLPEIYFQAIIRNGMSKNEIFIRAENKKEAIIKINSKFNDFELINIKKYGEIITIE